MTLDDALLGLKIDKKQNLERKVSEFHNKANRKNKSVGKFFKNRIYNLIALSAYMGFIGIFDYLIGLKLDHPMGDIAIGSGFLAGEARVEEDISKGIYSLAGLTTSIYPEITTLMASGNIETFLKTAGLKLVGYGAGAVISANIAYMIVSKYNSMLEIDVTFSDEKKANEAHKFISEVVEKSDYIRGKESSVDEPAVYGNEYKVHARVVGKEKQLTEAFRYALDTYFIGNIPSEKFISGIIKLRE